MTPGGDASRIPAGAFGALRNHGFRTFFAAVFFSTAGLQMDAVLRAWLTFHLTGSGLALGSVVLARGLPQLVLPLFAGVAVDRAEKRNLLLLAQFSLGALALLTAVLVHLRVIQLWHLIVIGVLQGVVLSFNLPLRHAYVGGLVERQALGHATALNTTALNVNNVLAPLVAGILLSRSPTLGFLLTAALFGVAGLRLTVLPKAPPLGVRRAIVPEIQEGVRYVARHAGLRALMGLLFVGVALGLPFQQFLPVFQSDVLRVDASALGMMYAVFGVGSVAGSLVVAHLSGHPQKTMIQLLAGAALGIGLVLFALSNTYLPALILLGLLGLAGQAFATMNSVLMMLTTRLEMQARVMSLSLIVWSFILLVAFPLGALVDLVGAAPTFATSGGLLAVVLLASFWRNQRSAALQEVPSQSLP